MDDYMHYKEAFQYILATIISIGTILAYPVKRYFARMNEITQKQDKLEDELKDVMLQDRIMQGELLLIKQHFIDCRKELKEDLREIKQTIGEIHKNILNTYRDTIKRDQK